MNVKICVYVVLFSFSQHPFWTNSDFSRIKIDQNMIYWVKFKKKNYMIAGSQRDSNSDDTDVDVSRSVERFTPAIS